MAKKVTLTITVNDEKALNDLGIGIVAERDGKITGYGNLTANELEKISIVFNTLVLHKEDNMNKEEIRKAKRILRRGTIKENAYNESEDNADTDTDTDGLMEVIKMEIKNIESYGFGPAIRGMRNSFASWDKSDSKNVIMIGNPHPIRASLFHIGPEDMKLMQKLYKAGGSERKFMRMIQVWCDISAPLTWWKQFDTYKVGTTANSTSTMHSIINKEFTLDDFNATPNDHLRSTICFLNEKRLEYLDTKEYYTWREIIDNLPESYIQMRTVNFNYETVAHMINDRKNHKLMEWYYFCYVMLENLPYLKEIMDV